MSFDELSTALGRLSAWPLQRTIRIRAEEKIGNSALGPRDRVDWLRQSGPISGEGKAAMADAWRSLGDSTKANEAAIDAWRNHSLERNVETDMLARYGDIFSQDDHRARADLLLWVNLRSEASRMKSRLTGGHSQLVTARIALAGRYRGVNQRISEIPSALHSHPGLLFERAKWRRKAGQRGTLAPLLVQIQGADVPEAGRGNLWNERNIVVRRMLEKGDYQTAYALAAPHGLTEGSEFAEAEWLSGWIALRHTNAPERALQHFESLSRGVSTPISLARAYYWKGRALSELGEIENANAAFREAAQYNFCLLYTSPSPRDATLSRMPSSA